MKIVFLISNLNSKSNGMGGHYRSLLVTAQKLKKEHEIIILNIGTDSSKALVTSELDSLNIKFSRYTFFKTINDLKKLVKNFEPDIIHSFDVNAHFWGRILSKYFKVSACLTICGGKNRFYTPYSDNIVLFSKENYEYLKAKNKFHKANIKLIPNRINKFEDDKYRIKILNQRLGKYSNSIKLLRISRIGKYYKKSLFQFINLVKKLKNQGINCCGIIIGVIEDQEVYQNLSEESIDNIFYFTDDYFSQNAKSQIAVSDIVMGTGRSFMEAASKGKILLAPIKNGEIPLLVDESNFRYCMEYNFSERINIPEYNENDNFNNIISSIKTMKKESRNVFSKKIFYKYFDSDKIAEKYTEFYNSRNDNKYKFMDLCIHFIFLFRNFIRK